MSPDQVILNALVYDGLGGEPIRRDVFLSDDRIRAVLPPDEAPHTGFRSLDASGLSLAPGFIDVHAHSDLTLLAAPEAFGKISQGITTEISGNCGQSFFPVTDCNRAHLTKLAGNYGVKPGWSDFSSYVSAVTHAVPAVNFNFLSGHGALRSAVLGYEEKNAAGEDIAAMRQLLADSLKNGCPGLSTGLIYVPGKFASKEELRSVFGVLRDFDALYATHMRSEGDALLEALDEALDLAACGAGRLQISHLKTAHPHNWHKLSRVFEKIEDARNRGMRVTADRYPYTYGQTSLSVILPEPYGAMTDAAIQNALSASPAECERCRLILEKESYWNRILLSFTSLPEYRSLLGLDIASCAARTGFSCASFVMDVLRRDASRAQGAFGGLSPENMERIILKPWVCCGTDENARPADESLGRSHPRGFGSMPRFLNIVRRHLSLAEAIRKTTSLPASVFRLADRGVIRPGAFADLVLFDEENLADAADFAHPHVPASGIRCVWVNGIPAYVPGETIRRAGRFVCSQKKNI